MLCAKKTALLGYFGRFRLLAAFSQPYNYITEDDVKIAKNYLSEKELQRLNLMVSQFLDFGELQALDEKPMKMQDWVKALNNQIIMSQRKILEGKGKISHDEAMEKAEQREVGVKQIVKQPALNLSTSAGLVQSTGNNIY